MTFLDFTHIILKRQERPQRVLATEVNNISNATKRSQQIVRLYLCHHERIKVFERTSSSTSNWCL